MKRFIFIIFVLLTTSIILVAQFKKHTVVKGDCLWDIAGYYYNDPFLWPVIYKANEDSIADPHWIYPGEVFVIPNVPEEQTTTMPVEEGIVKEIRGTKGELQEEMGEARGTMETGDEELILFSVVKAEDYAFTKKAALLAGFITRDDIGLGRISKRLQPVKELKEASTVLGEKVEVNRGTSDGISVGDFFVIFKWDSRVGRYGKIVRIKGILKITKAGEAFSEAQIIDSYEAIDKGDYIMEYSSPELVIGDATPITLELEGKLIAIKNKQDVIKPFSVVYIDLGTNSAVQLGDVFLIYKYKEDLIEPLGQIQIVDVREETSSAYITSIMGNTNISLGNKIKLVGRIGG
jgi:hypothetical protein